MKKTLFNPQNRQKAKYNKILSKIKERESLRFWEGLLCNILPENLIKIEECKEIYLTIELNVSKWIYYSAYVYFSTSAK